MAPPTQVPRLATDKCIVFWDYENMENPRGQSLGTTLSKIKTKIWDSMDCLQNKIPIQFIAYIRASKVTDKIQKDFDENGIKHIHIPSTKPESVDKRIMMDMMFELYELERDNKSRAIALISGDKDFSHLLNKMHHTPPISHLYLILLHDAHIDKNYENGVDKIITLNSTKSVEPMEHDQRSANNCINHNKQLQFQTKKNEEKDDNHNHNKADNDNRKSADPSLEENKAAINNANDNHHQKVQIKTKRNKTRDNNRNRNRNHNNRSRSRHKEFHGTNKFLSKSNRVHKQRKMSDKEKKVEREQRLSKHIENIQDIRKCMPCMNGNYCHYWLKGICRYYHEPHNVPAVCVHGQQCWRWRQGICRYFHPGPPGYGNV